MQQRKKISRRLSRQLLIEAGYKCAIPRCEHEDGLEFHHINEDPTDNDFDNLIVLCAVHHAMATKGRVDRTACKFIKSLLRQDRLREESGFIELETRYDVNDVLCHYIQQTKSYRAILSGPYFLHPDWYYARRASTLGHQDFDKLEHDFIFSNKRAKSSNIRIALSQSPRYVLKLNKVVDAAERLKFRSDVLEKIKALWGSRCETGPQISFLSSSFMHVIYVFDSAVITQYRPNQKNPTGGGLLHKAPRVVEHERIRFDAIFDGNSNDIRTEVSHLRYLAKSLWAEQSIAPTTADGSTEKTN